MPFFKDIRRRSRASFRTKGSSSGSSNENVPHNKSSSTLNSFYTTSTPTSTIHPQQSSSNLNSSSAQTPPVPARPAMSATQSNRNSAYGLGSIINGGKQQAPTSPYAPRILSVSDNALVHQKVLLIYGQIADPAQQPLDGNLVVLHHHDSFPPTNWPVCASHFKALVHLTPGPNRLRLDFISPKIPSNTTTSAHSSGITINYLPLTASPPLQLAILVAKDSPLTFDAVPERIHREDNGLETAVRKYRMAAYLWQAFTGEQMYRQRFGRRCFRFEEEWQTGSLTLRDRETGQMRNEAKVHIVRSEKTAEEIRDLEVAQQYEKANRKGDLFSYAMDAVRDYFRPSSGQKQYVSVLILDSQWDKSVGTIRGHAALGGGAGDIQLAIFGSHCLQSYPTSIEEVVPAFTDCTRTDTDHVANDCNESGSNWEAANIGIGAHLHETGHLFGCPHQENGVMARDYVRLNRTFTCREPYSTRTKSPGQRVCLAKDECSWHRLDCLRFRYHPCFSLPTDPPTNLDDSVQVWNVGNGTAIATAASGIGFIELYAGDDTCKTYIDYTEGNGSGAGGPPRQIPLNEGELRSRLSEQQRGRPLKLELHSAGQGTHTVESFGELTAKASAVRMANGQSGFKGSKLGFSQMEGSCPEEMILDSVLSSTKLLVQIKVYSGFAIDGIEFVYEDFSSQLFGKKGGKPGGDDFHLDTRRGETLMGFYLRAGQWIDGLEILTSLGRRSGVFGNPTGGSGHTLIPPRGYTIAGISGSCGPWVDGFALIITR